MAPRSSTPAQCHLLRVRLMPHHSEPGVLCRLPAVLLGVGDLSYLGGIAHGGQDTAEAAHAEKTFAARTASVCGKSEQAFQPEQGAIIDALAGDMFEVEIPTSRAMHVPDESDGHAPGAKAHVTGVAPPGTQSPDAP